MLLYLSRAKEITFAMSRRGCHTSPPGARSPPLSLTLTTCLEEPLWALALGPAFLRQGLEKGMGRDSACQGLCRGSLASRPLPREASFSHSLPLPCPLSWRRAAPWSGGFVLTSPPLRTAPVSFCVGPRSLCRVAGDREPSDVLDGPATPGGSTAF